MVNSVKNIICDINAVLKASLAGSLFHGVSYPLEREGRQTQTVGSYDDDFAVMGYHKLRSINVTQRPGFGNNEKTFNTYNMELIIYNNENKSKILSPDLSTVIQSKVSDLNIQSARIRFSSILFDSKAIFTAEYRGNDFRLPPNQSLIQFNYQIEIAFNSRCFDVCSEDFINN